MKFAEWFKRRDEEYSPANGPVVIQTTKTLPPMDTTTLAPIANQLKQVGQTGGQKGILQVLANTNDAIKNNRSNFTIALQKALSTYKPTNTQTTAATAATTPTTPITGMR